MATSNSRRNPDARNDDLYTTPKWAIDAILKREELEGTILDAGCGTGNITNAMIKYGYDHDDITTIDKYDHGYTPDIITDFTVYDPYEQPNNVISNPPFKLLTEFILHSLKIASDKVLIFARINVLEGINRYKSIYKNKPPSRVYIFVNRVSCFKGGDENINHSGAVMYCWLVWDLEHKFNMPTVTYWLDARK